MFAVLPVKLVALTLPVLVLPLTINELNTPTPRNIDDAPCQTVDPETFFPDPTDLAGIEKAKTLCGNCDHEIKNKCLSFALSNKIHYGIWGGLTEIERKSVLRKQYREGSYGQM